jgi:hypothetical protein
MWEEKDREYYTYCKQQYLGQIANDDFSRNIEQIAGNTNFKTFLEIGTWNGLGSTLAFSNGFRNRNDDYVLYSLECNKDKCADAVSLYSGNKKIQILNEVIWNEEPADFYKIFPQCLTNQLFKRWNEVDLINMKQCKLFLTRQDLPDVFDVLLLDGGEFTTYYEFQLLKNRCKVLMLDDINTDKCLLIVRELKADPTWKILHQNTTRNGFLIAEKI